jgi:hypothetical protein
MQHQLEVYAQDRERLLLELRRKGVRGWVPAQLVRDAILHCGWRIERDYGVEASLLALCRPDQRAVLIPVDFRARLRVPETEAAMLNETLAQQLGQIRLQGPDRQRDADDYARVFLVPLVKLMTRLPMLELLKAEKDKHRWYQLQRLALEFRVTLWFLGITLEMYGLARVDQARRRVELLPASYELARRFAFGRLA